MLKAAASTGEANAWGVTMLEDRIRVRSGENQVYAQISNVVPMGSA